MTKGLALFYKHFDNLNLKCILDAMQCPSRQSASSFLLRASSTHAYHLRLHTTIPVMLKIHLEMGMAHQWKAPRQTEITITSIARGENLRPQPIDVAGGHVTLCWHFKTLAPMCHSASVTIMTLRRELQWPPSQWEHSAISGTVLTWKSGPNTSFFV